MRRKQAARGMSWRRIAGGSSYLLAIASVAALLFLLVLSSFFSWRFDAVMTGSMSPTFRIGGVVVIRPVDAVTMEVGDVITYWPPRETRVLVTHRVVEVIGEGDSRSFRTRGNGVEEEDTYQVPARSVVGRVWFYIPLFGRFCQFAKTPAGITLCLIVPGGWIILGECRKLAAIAARGKRGRQSRKL